MDRKILVTAVCAALAFPLTMQAAKAQEADPATAADPTSGEGRDSGVAELDRVLVTGSRIHARNWRRLRPRCSTSLPRRSRSRVSATSPTCCARSRCRRARWRTTEFAGSFTATATTISLLGLSPSFTLILFDGRPLADYPLLYNGQSDFTDLSQHTR